MYQVQVVNTSSYPVRAIYENEPNNIVIAPNAEWTSNPIGNIYILLGATEMVSIMDIGDGHYPGDAGGTWGVLVTYKGTSVVGRYDGGGMMTVTITPEGLALLSGSNITLRPVDLPPLQIASPQP